MRNYLINNLSMNLSLFIKFKNSIFFNVFLFVTISIISHSQQQNYIHFIYFSFNTPSGLLVFISVGKYVDCLAYVNQMTLYNNLSK